MTRTDGGTASCRREIFNREREMRSGASLRLADMLAVDTAPLCAIFRTRAAHVILLWPIRIDQRLG